MNNTQDIAILGGTFDPIHSGHLIAGQAVMDTGLFQEVWIMPSGEPPHKASDPDRREHRLEMCRIASDTEAFFQVSDLEIRRTGKTYTLDTFRELKDRWPMRRFWLIIGTDSLMQLHQWRLPDLLLKEVNFAVVDRGGHPLDAVKAKMEAYKESHGTQFRHIPMPLIELSSSDIRERVAKGKSIRFRVPDQILTYIEDEGLYR